MTPWLLAGITVLMVRWLDSLDNPLLRRLFNWIPAILLAYVIPATVSGAAGWDFSGDAIHRWSRNLFIPLAIVTVMSSLSIRQLKAVGWRPILLFASGSAWIALFPVMFLGVMQAVGAAGALFTDPGYWLGVPPIVGSWIGGSTSQLVLKELSACPEPVFLSVLVLDTLLVNSWTILMFQGIRRSEALNRRLGIRDSESPSDLALTGASTTGRWQTLLAIATVVLLSQLLSDRFALQVIALSVAGLLLGNRVRDWDHAGALRAGGLLILLVMAVLGLRLRLESLSFDGAFLGFLILWLVSHFVWMLWVARRLNLHAAWVPIASMANVGGIATAPAVTAAYRPQWMPHAILLAILSMASGTFWGMLTLWLLRGLGV